MTEKSELAPNVVDGYAPLENLVTYGLVDFGDFSGLIGGTGGLMFVRFANHIIEELRQHPYWPPDVKLDYYKSISEVRPIPDIIMEHGLVFKYASQQGSEKAQMYGAQFLRTMNTVLWNRLNGNTKIQLRVMDGGSNSHYAQGETSATNGLVSNPTES